MALVSRSTMKTKLQITLFAFTLALLSCQPKEEPRTREKALSQGFSMMDQGRYDEAIQYFTELSQKDPHKHVKLALASAYAGRAGVKIEQIYSFVAVKSLPSVTTIANSRGVEEGTVALMDTLARYSEQWNRIPSIDTQKLADLQRALKVLENDTEPGVRLYAATLRVVVLKSSVTVGLKNWQKTVSAKFCRDDLRAYFDWGVRILENVELLCEDLQAAFPQDEKRYKDIQNRVQRLQEDAGKILWPRENLCL